MNTKTEAELEVDNVVLREALVDAQVFLMDIVHPNIPSGEVGEKLARVTIALSSTTDYSNKVVVDKEDRKNLRRALRFYANKSNWEKDTWGVCCISSEYGAAGATAREALRLSNLARLDSIRGKATS